MRRTEMDKKMEGKLTMAVFSGKESISFYVQSVC